MVRENPAGTPPEQAPLDEPLVYALTSVVLAAHGDHIPEDQRNRVRESIRNLREVADTLTKYPLTNADEPEPFFSAFRGED